VKPLGQNKVICFMTCQFVNFCVTICVVSPCFDSVPLSQGVVTARRWSRSLPRPQKKWRKTGWGKRFHSCET